VRTLEDWASKTDMSQVTVVVGVHNHQVAMAPLMANIAATGAKRVINPVQLHACLPALTDAYWLTAPCRYAAHAAELQRLQALLHDDFSLDVFHRVLEFRLTGNYACLPAARHADQYMPHDLPRWQTPMRLIDCGAYNGDTVLAMRKQGYSFGQLLCFEPDPANYMQLCTVVKDLGSGFCLPCGVSDKTGLMRFSASGTGASNISGTGELVIQCVAIDDVAPGFAPTLIKMDVEGAEPQALAGAQRTIGTYRPALAISIYHQYAHLWQLPLLIDSWRLDYDFHLRMHGNSSFDLVLYALPRN
jgi:FkbM family methyltransferase